MSAGTPDFLSRAAEILGQENVVAADSAHAYRDPYPLHPEAASSAGVRPGSVEEVQQIVRLANGTATSLWTVSRGKNLGYGGAAPRTADQVVLDLSRMNSIQEVDGELGYAVIEPGVTFFDLFECIQERRLSLFVSVPALGWGSVLGNALDRGYGMSPYGDHVQQLCGLEVVLPNGELLRTGMWAMEDSPLGHVFKGGFGPNIDQLFTQSGLGVVVRAGIWLMPWPEAFASGEITVENQDDLPQLIDSIAELRRREVFQNNCLVGNVVRAGTMNGPRSRWYTGEGSIPDHVVEEMREAMGIGNWNARFALYGDPGMIRERIRIIEERFNRSGFTVRVRLYEGSDGGPVTYADIDEKDQTTMAGVPSLKALSTVSWYAEDGGHIDIAPLMPARGEEVYDFYQEVKDLYAEYGFDLYIGYHVYARHLVHVTMIFFENGNPEQLARARELYDKVRQAARRRGYSPYRGHINNMDDIAAEFSFNDHAVLRFQETLKDILDPAGVISPGKQGVWPKRLRTSR
ncbi:FAD-binding oxidoreductase [Nesterenkonia muleiensis]|uniref:FAD-binding oxidoreductase n=1 Tax=Nesterenkonia muleiensis TaxID=2282648 RepID=UPI000E71A7F2|nr:FAD-binding oxidoreductase [Nesterenkonia muleiensis]